MIGIRHAELRRTARALCAESTTLLAITRQAHVELFRTRAELRRLRSEATRSRGPATAGDQLRGATSSD